jgi:hypothetical protein
MQDMDPFGKEQGNDHQHIDGLIPELVHGVLDGGGVHVHKTALHHKIRVFAGNMSCSLFDKFLIVGEFTSMANQ